MKKLLFILAVILTAISLTACADKANSSSPNDKEIQSSEGGVELPEDDF